MLEFERHGPSCTDRVGANPVWINSMLTQFWVFIPLFDNRLNSLAGNRMIFPFDMDITDGTRVTPTITEDVMDAVC